MIKTKKDFYTIIFNKIHEYKEEMQIYDLFIKSNAIKDPDKGILEIEYRNENNLPYIDFMSISTYYHIKQFLAGTREYVSLSEPKLRLICEKLDIPFESIMFKITE